MVVYVYADMAGKNSNLSEDEVEEEILLGSCMSNDKKFYVFKQIKENAEDKQQWLPCYSGDNTNKRLEKVEYNDVQKNFDEMKAKVNKLKDLQLFCAWWKYARFAILLILATTISGCSMCVYSVSIVLLIKYPDHYVEKNGYRISSSYDCPTGTIESYFIGLAITSHMLPNCRTFLWCGNY